MANNKPPPPSIFFLHHDDDDDDDDDFRESISDEHNHVGPTDSSNPFAPDDFINSSNWYSDSDSDSVSCFVTDLFGNRSSDNDPFTSHVNPFSADGLRIVPFSSESDTCTDDVDEQNQLHRVLDNHNSDNNDDNDVDDDGDRIVSGFDDFDVNFCWDSLCLEDQRTLNEWEDLEEVVNHDGEDSSVVVGEVDDDDGDRSVASGLSYGEEEGYLEWEILLAVNNLERDSGLEVAGALMTVEEDGYVNTAEYDVFFGQLMENESFLKGSPPTAKSVLENLPLVELTEEDLVGENVACAVCKDEIVGKEKVRRLPCLHFYHGDCIMPWLSIRNTCPVCRFELPTDDPDYEQRKSQRSALESAHDMYEFAL